MGLSSSTMESGTISAGAEQALGPELASGIVEMAQGNKDAMQFVNMIEHLPKNVTPVDDNIIEFLNENVNKIVNEIREKTGITALSAEDIRLAAKSARKFGINAIPYVVGIAATVAAANPAAGVGAAAAASTAVSIATGIEDAIYNVALQTKTPAFLKNFGAAMSHGKKIIGNILNKIWSTKGGAYDDLKRQYGHKHGSCDCDKVGSREEDLGLMAAKEYMKTSSSAAKSGLARDIINSMAVFIRKPESIPSNLDDVEKANWLLANTFGTSGNNESIKPEKVDAAMSALVSVLNKYLGREIIDPKLPKEVKAVQAAELLHALTVGMHLEFLVVQGDIQNIQMNLDYIGQLEKDIVEKISNIAEKEEKGATDSLLLGQYKDALGLLTEESKRQVSLIKAITTGTINEADKKIMDMIKDGSLIVESVSEINNPSNESFRGLIYKLINMTILTGATAAFLEKSLKEVGLKVDDYKKMSNLGELRDAVAKMSPKMNDTPDKMYKFSEAVNILEKNFNRRAELGQKSGSRDYEPSAVSKKIEATKNIRAINLRGFTNNLFEIKKNISSSLEKIVPFVAVSIPRSEELDVFLNRIDVLCGKQLGDDMGNVVEIDVLKGKTYEALSGAITDPLAIQIRNEILGDYKMLRSAVEALKAKSQGPGADALGDLIQSIDAFIRLSDESAEKFSKIVGSADITSSMSPLTGVRLEDQTIALVIDKIKKAILIAKVQENIKGIVSGYKGVDAEYERMTGKSIAGVLNDINVYQSKLLNLVGTSEATNPGITDFVSAQCESLRNVWKAAEAIDYYLGNFTHDIRLNASEVNDIMTLMEEVTVSKDTYDAKLGNLYTSVFDCFPMTDGADAGKVNEAALKNTGDRHYYSLFTDGDSYPGNPLVGTEFARGLEASKRARLFISKFTTFKNMVNIFYSLGAKYGSAKTKEAMKYMNPSSLLKAIMDYACYGSFILVDPATIDKIAATKAAVTIAARNLDFTTEVTLENSIIAHNAEAIAAEKITKKEMGMSLRTFADYYANIIPAEKLDGTGALDGNKIDKPMIFLRSESDFHRGDPVFLKTDDIFVSLIKSMLAKIMACIETFEIMKKPMNYNIKNSAVRQILGGADSDHVRPEYVDLYVRLPLLVKFYKNILSMDDGDDTTFGKYPRLDKSKTQLLKISILPDIDGTYGPLVKYLFTNDRIGIDNLTQSQMNIVVQKINDIADKATGSTGDEKIKNVLQGFIREVNRRFAIVTKDDFDDYKKLRDEESSLWGSIPTINSADYINENALIGAEVNDVSFNTNLPSGAYVTEAMNPDGIFGANMKNYKKDHKYYGEYAKLYTNFRRKVDSVIEKGTVDTMPKIKELISSIKTKMRSEMSLSKKLALLTSLHQTTDLNDLSRAKYVAFHEIIITSLNSLSIIDAFVSNIIASGYFVDPAGFGLAALKKLGGATFAAVGALVFDPDELHKGIVPKNINKLVGRVIEAGGLNTLNSAGKSFDDIADRPNIKGYLADLSLQSIVNNLLLNTLYSLCGNELFDVKITKEGISISFDGLKNTVEKLYASAKSTMEKFRPHIDPAFFELYAGLFTEDNDMNTVYSIYHDLIVVKINGARIVGTPKDLDKVTGYYYGLERACAAINNYFQAHVNKDSLTSALSESVIDDSIVFKDIKPVRWNNMSDSSIERLHVYSDGLKAEMDLRFANRYNSFYNLDQSFKQTNDVFQGTIQLISRFLSRCYDPMSNKIYKGCISAFEKVFPNELTNPFMGYPDIFPSLFVNSKRATKNVVLVDDSYSFANETDFNTVAVNTIAPVRDLSAHYNFFGASSGPTFGDSNNRQLPDIDRLLPASLANIINNARRNKNSTGSLANLAESWTDINGVTKDRIREELPIFKKFFKELRCRVDFLSEFVNHYANQGMPVPARKQVPVFPAVMKEQKDSTLVLYLMKFLAKISSVADSFEKAVDDMTKELMITNEYGELFPGYIKNYQMKYGTLPYVPVSLIYSYLFAGPMIRDEKEGLVQFIPSTKSQNARFLSNYVNGSAGVANSPMIDLLLKKFEEVIQGPEILKKEDVKNAIDGSVRLIKYLGDCRNYKSLFCRFVAVNDITYKEILYPEYSDKNPLIYYKNFVSAPFAQRFLVDDSSATSPGIVIRTNKANNGAYINVCFIENSPEKMLSSLQMNDVYEQFGEIYGYFQVVQKNVVLSGDNLAVWSILDLNLVPIDFSELSRSIPLSNIMNYSYTMDSMALDILVKNDAIKKAIHKELVEPADPKVGPMIITPNSETLMYALLVNPFGKAETSNSLVQNMFTGSTQIKLGRPKFLSDQMFQKSLFGELVNARSEYTERGAKTVGVINRLDTTSKSTVNKPIRLIRGGSGYKEAKLNDLFGILAIKKAFNDFVADANSNLTSPIAVDLSELDNGAIGQVTIKFDKNGTSTNYVFTPASLDYFAYKNALDGIKITVINGGTTTITVPGAVAVDFTTRDGVAAFDKTFSAPVSYDVPKYFMLENDADLAKNITIANRGDIIRYLQKTIGEEYDNLLKKGSFIIPTAGIATNTTKTDIVQALVDTVEAGNMPYTPVQGHDVLGDAATIIRALLPVGTDNKKKWLLYVLTGKDVTDDMIRGMPDMDDNKNSYQTMIDFVRRKKIDHKPLENVAALTVSTGKGRLQGVTREHPILRYFKKTDVNDETERDSINYIDPEKDGYQRVVPLKVGAAKKAVLAAIGNNRFDTFYARIFVFMINAYRTVLYRLREDSKNPDIRMASKFMDIIDDDNTEFYGFDMIE